MNEENPVISKLFIEALDYACKRHKRQTRKGTSKDEKKPYIAHLLGTASIAYEYGANETEAIAALLHDAIEDQGGKETEEEIKNLFGSEIAKIVRGCSDTDTEPKPPWKERKEAYIKHLEIAAASIHLVSASDKLYNARTILQDYRIIGDEIWDRFKGKKDGTLWYYRALADAFIKQANAPAELAKELDRVVRKIEKMAGTQE